MLRYIVSHLRERALSSDCQYTSATIFDGLNNLKEKKSSFWRKKKACGRKTIQIPILFFKNLRIRELLYSTDLRGFNGFLDSWN